MPPVIYFAKNIKSLVPAFAILAGCAVTPPITGDGGFAAPEFRHIEVNQVQHRHDIAFAHGAVRPSADERRRLDVFLARLNIRPGDPVLVLTAAGGSDMDLSRREFTAAFLKARRLRIAETLSNFGKERPPADRVRLLFRRHAVTVRGCPDFTKEPRHNYGNTLHSNFGCAVETNLGLMVARPGDLVRGRQMGPMDGTVAAGAVERYRLGETAPLADPDSGRIETGTSTGDEGS